MKQDLLFDIKVTDFNLPSQVFFNIFKTNLSKHYLRSTIFLIVLYFITLSYMIECNNIRYEKYVT